MFALLFAGATALLPGSAVVFGPGTGEMRLVVSKLVARSGVDTTLIANVQQVESYEKLMYGDAKLTDGAAKIVAVNSEISAALAQAQALCIVCDEGSLPESPMMSALEAAPDLQKIVLLSRMGVSKATAGFMGLGKGEVEMQECEARLRAAAGSRGLDLSVVRVGSLKGGGPGAMASADSEEIGLSQNYYDTILELETALVTQAYDKYSLGCSLKAGDTIEAQNTFSRLANKGSFEPRPDETSRVVAGGAVVATLAHPKPVEFTLSATKGTAAPTADEWQSMLEGL